MTGCSAGSGRGVKGRAADAVVRLCGRERRPNPSWVDRAVSIIIGLGDLDMPRLNFGAFLAPHHPIGEHPMLQFRRDLDLVEQLDTLGYEEFWCGEHHSSGWEMIGSPEMFLAAAGERTKRIKLATGVISLDRKSTRLNSSHLGISYAVLCL